MITGACIFIVGAITGSGLLWLGMFLAQDFKYKAIYGMPVREENNGSETPEGTEAAESEVLVPWHTDYK